MVDSVKEHSYKLAQTYITLGAKFYGEYVTKEYLKNYPNFISYVKAEHKDIKYSFAKYCIELFRMFKITGISLSQVSDIPWARIEMLRRVVNKYNIQEFLNAARLQDDYHFAKKVGQYKKPRKRLNTGKQTLFIQCETGEHYESIKEKLDVLKKDLDVNSYAKVLDYLLADHELYLQGLSLDTLLEHIEEKYAHVIITIEEIDGK